MHAMNYLADYLSDSPSELVELVQAAEAKEFALVFPELDRRREQTIALLERAVGDDAVRPAATEADKDRAALRQARAALALFRQGAVERVWPLLAHSRDPRLRSFLIHWLTRLGEDPATMQRCLDQIEAHAPAGIVWR